MGCEDVLQELVIIGAGGFGREVKWLVDRINQRNMEQYRTEKWKLLGFIDDGIPVGTLTDNLPSLGGTEWMLEKKEPIAVACAIGSAEKRRKVVESIKSNRTLEFPKLLDPSVLMSDSVRLGKGNIICAGTILAVDISIEDFLILNLDCTVGYDTVLESYVTVYPSVNISGAVHVHSCVEIGTGCHIIQGKTIGAGTIVGAGAVVVKDLPEHCTAVGNPARPVKFY